VLLNATLSPSDPCTSLCPFHGVFGATPTNLHPQFRWLRSRRRSTMSCGTAQAGRYGRRPRRSWAGWSPAECRSGRRSRRRDTLLLMMMVREAMVVRNGRRRWDWRKTMGSCRPVGRAAGRWSGTRRRSWAGCGSVRRGGGAVCGLELL